MIPISFPSPYQPLKIGQFTIWPPVVLAPMAGITDVAFRQLVSEFGSGLLVAEMVSADLLVKGNKQTRQMIQFFPGEGIRSVQLYGTNPGDIFHAIRILKAEFNVKHVDLNFGCPMPKITRKGGGAALPLHRKVFPAILEAAMTAAEGIPITIKFRLGLDEEYVYFKAVAAQAVAMNIAAVTLHARTAAQFYSGKASWQAVRELVEMFPALTIIGNGDVWTAQHALQMMLQTGCHGVGLGRTVLGRPFLFRHLKEVFAGRPEPYYPNLEEIAAIARRHLQLMLQYFEESVAIRRFRKHLKWYFQGFSPAVQQRVKMLLQKDRGIEVEKGLRAIKGKEPYPPEQIWKPRGKTTQQPRVVLPIAYRQHLATGEFVVEEMMASGG